MALSPGEIEYVKRLRKAGADDENVLYYLEKRRIDEAKMNAPKEKSIAGKTFDFFRNVGAGAVQAGGDVSIGALGQISRILPGDQSADPNSFYNTTRKILDFSKQGMRKGGVDTDSFGFLAGNTAINLASAYALSGGIANMASRGINLAGRVNGLSRFANTANRFGKFMQSGTTLGNITKGAVTGANDMLSYDVTGGREVTAGNIALGAVTGGAMPMIGKGISRATNFITQSLPKSLISRGLVTPSALKNASERLSRLSDDGIIDIDSSPQWLLDKGLSGTKKQIQEGLVKVMKDSGKQKLNLLSSYKEPVSGPVVSDLKTALREILPSYAKVANGKVIPKAGNDAIVKEILGFIKKKDTSIMDLERARTLLGNMGIFRTSGELTDSATKEGLQRVWIGTSKYIDDIIPGFRTVNKDIEVAHALAKAIGLKEAQDSARQLLSMTNIMSGGIGAGYGYMTTGDWKKAVGFGLAGVGGKYLLNNNAVTTNVAKGLSKMGGVGLTKGGKIVKGLVKGGSRAIAPIISDNNK